MTAVIAVGATLLGVWGVSLLRGDPQMTFLVVALYGIVLVAAGFVAMIRATTWVQRATWLPLSGVGLAFIGVNTWRVAGSPHGPVRWLCVTLLLVGLALALWGFVLRTVAFVDKRHHYVETA